MRPSPHRRSGRVVRDWLPRRFAVRTAGQPGVPNVGNLTECRKAPL